MNKQVCLRTLYASVALIIALTMSFNTLEIRKYMPLSVNKPIRNVISIIQPSVAGKLLKPTMPAEEELSALCELIRTHNSSQIISANFSRVELVAINDDRVEIAIQAYDMANRPMTAGNDVILIWASNSDGTGSVAGNVIDYKNGTYTGYLRFFWDGKTTIYVKLASIIENACLKMNALRKYGISFYANQQPWGIRGNFINQLEKELTICGANDNMFGIPEVCNFTSLNGGMDWFCVHPKNKKLQCSDINSFESGKFDIKISEHEQIRHLGHGDFKENIILDLPVINRIREKNQQLCKARSPFITWIEPHPTGYWLRGQWNFVNCVSSIKHSNATYRRCLKSKYLVIIGDSTVRQYAEYIINSVLELVEVKLYDSVGPNRTTYHSFKEFSNHGIRLRNFKHEMPFYNRNFPSKGIISVPEILKSIADDRNIREESLVVLLNYYSHFEAYPPNKLRKRLNILVSDIKYLLTNKPRAKVFFKGPHLSTMNPHISQLYQKIMEEEFSSIMDSVAYLDVWSITVAHNSETMHPRGNAFISQINQFMAYLC